MSKEDKIKRDERGAAVMVWSVMIILIIIIIGLVVWANGSLGTPATSAAQITPTVASVGVTATTTDTSEMAAAAPALTPASATSTINSNVRNNEHMVTIQTNKGTIVFETYDADAPNTVNNFITLANKGFYNGVIFHRIIQGFMIQGGDPTGTGRGGPGYTFADELNPAAQSYKTGYVRGTVAMANAGPNTNGSQFFIMQDGTPLPNSYTIFGHVISGMDVVDTIAAVPVDGNDKPLSPITMEKVTVATTSPSTAQ